MADIFIMDRQISLKWLINTSLVTALLLPLTAFGGEKLVVIVGEQPIVENSAIAPTPEMASAATDEVAQPAIADSLVTRPNIDIFTQREKPLEFITLNSVLFAHNGTALDNKAKLILNDIAAHLQDNDSVERLLINGFADKIASSDYNAKLSAKRAFVVREYLRHIGVSTNLLHTVSWGEGHPTDEHWTNNGRKRNRRVELYLVQKPASM